MPLPEAPATGTLPFEPPTEFSPDLGEFWQLWREERFWACHEALEEVWKDEVEPRRSFLNGLIHGAVAVFQHRRGNAVGAARQMVRAQVKCERHRPAREGVNLEAFLAGVEAEIAPSREHLNDFQREALRELEARLRTKYLAT
jgi:predicted metal-dependent hydrolase